MATLGVDAAWNLGESHWTRRVRPLWPQLRAWGRWVQCPPAMALREKKTADSVGQSTIVKYRLSYGNCSLTSLTFDSFSTQCIDLNKCLRLYFHHVPLYIIIVICNCCIYTYIIECRIMSTYVCIYIYTTWESLLEISVPCSAIFSPLWHNHSPLQVECVKRLLPSPLDLCFLRLFDVPNQTSARAGCKLERDGCLNMPGRSFKDYSIKNSASGRRLVDQIWCFQVFIPRAQGPNSSFHHRFQQWGHGSKYDLSPKCFTTEFS